MLVEGPTLEINGRFGSPEKKFSITFSNTKFCLSFHYNADNNYLFLTEKEIFKFKAAIKIPIQLCLGSISDGFSAAEFREVSLNGNVHGFSDVYNSTDKSDILKIHKYLIILRVPKKKKKDVSVKAFKIIINKNEAKTKTKHFM